MDIKKLLTKASYQLKCPELRERKFRFVQTHGEEFSYTRDRKDKRKARVECPDGSTQYETLAFLMDIFGFEKYVGFSYSNLLEDHIENHGTFPSALGIELRLNLDGQEKNMHFIFGERQWSLMTADTFLDAYCSMEDFQGLHLNFIYSRTYLETTLGPDLYRKLGELADRVMEAGGNHEYN
jgi:hypothetical protein